MQIYFYRFIQFLFPNIIFIGNKKAFYLTIDDSPSPYTEWILDELDRFNVKATFFCIGKNIEKYPDMYREIKTRGHKLGYHSYEHENTWRISFLQFKSDFKKSEGLYASTIYRPPYGKWTLESYQYLKAKNIHLILWNILLKDWIELDHPAKLIQKRLKNAPLGSIFVFHDNEKSKKNIKIMLPIFLQYAETHRITILPID